MIVLKEFQQVKYDVFFCFRRQITWYTVWCMRWP